MTPADLQLEHLTLLFALIAFGAIALFGDQT